MRVAKSALLYFAIVFGAGFILGSIRVLVLEPRLGRLASTLCESPFLLGAIWFGARRVPTWLSIDPQIVNMLAMGFGALVLGLGADFIVGLTMRGMTRGDQFAYFATAPGQLYFALLTVFALMPSLANRSWLKS